MKDNIEAWFEQVKKTLRFYLTTDLNFVDMSTLAIKENGKEIMITVSFEELEDKK